MAVYQQIQIRMQFIAKNIKERMIEQKKKEYVDFSTIHNTYNSMKLHMTKVTRVSQASNNTDKPWSKARF